MTNTETVKYFDAATAPVDPFNGLRQPGWYWLVGEDWNGPAPNGEPEARFHAARNHKDR